MTIILTDTFLLFGCSLKVKKKTKTTQTNKNTKKNNNISNE